MGAGGLVPDIAFFSRGFAFLLLDPVKFLDQIRLEFNRYPRGDLAGDVFVGVGATLYSALDIGRCLSNPCFGVRV